jgi:hypothetical protein
MRPDKILEQGAEMFRQRNALYGDTHTDIGFVLLALDPGTFGEDVRAANRQFLVSQIANKLCRYVSLLKRGGHKDSARDIMVYAAMLEEMTDEKPHTVVAATSDGSGTGQSQ